MPKLYPAETREQALQWLTLGETVSATALLVGAHRRTVERWRNEAIESLPEPGTIEAELKKQCLFRQALAARRTIALTEADEARQQRVTVAQRRLRAQAEATLDAIAPEIARLTGGQGFALPKASPRALLVRRPPSPTVTPRRKRGRTVQGVSATT